MIMDTCTEACFITIVSFRVQQNQELQTILRNDIVDTKYKILKNQCRAEFEP